MKKSKTKKRKPRVLPARKPCVSRDGSNTFCGRVACPEHPALTVAGVPRGEIICRACMEAAVLIWIERRHDAEWRDADRVFSEAL